MTTHSVESDKYDWLDDGNGDEACFTLIRDDGLNLHTEVMAFGATASRLQQAFSAEAALDTARIEVALWKNACAWANETVTAANERADEAEAMAKWLAAHITDCRSCHHYAVHSNCYGGGNPDWRCNFASPDTAIAAAREAVGT